MSDEKKVKPCPTMHGTHSAYQPEWREGHDGKWQPIPTEKRGACGVPQTGPVPGVNSTVGLHGYKQAMALAWWFAAHADAEHALLVEVRVVPYRVEFDIKATADEAAAVSVTELLMREP